MRRVIVLTATGVALAGCSSMSLPSFDFMKPEPTVLTLQLDSRPPGATATTSVGPSCVTPCVVQLPATPGVSVTYTLDRFLPQTVALQVTQHQGQPAPDGTAPIVTDFDPNPAFVELQPAIPPRKGRKPVVAKKKPPKVNAQSAAQPAPPPPNASPFPPPPAQSH